jgi:hypothetical protein
MKKSFFFGESLRSDHAYQCTRKPRRRSTPRAKRQCLLTLFLSLAMALVSEY